MNTAKGAEGGFYKATLPSVGDGDVVPQAADSSGRILPGDVNQIVIVAASALVTPQTINFDYTNPYFSAGILVVDITAVAGTTYTLDVKMQTYDPVSNQYVDTVGVAMAQKSAAGTTIIQIIPGIVASANIAISTRLPNRLRIVQTVAGSGVTPSVTYSIGLSLMR